MGGLEVELYMTNNEIEGSLYNFKCTSASSPVTCKMFFWKLPNSGGEVFSKGGIECGERDKLYIIDKCVIQKGFRGTK